MNELFNRYITAGNVIVKELVLLCPNICERSVFDQWRVYKDDIGYYNKNRYMRLTERQRGIYIKLNMIESADIHRG